MHWLEGINNDWARLLRVCYRGHWYPSELQKRQTLEGRLPWVKNRILMYGMAAFLWVFGFSAVLGLVK